MKRISLMMYVLFGMSVCYGYTHALRGGYRMSSLWAAPRAMLWGAGTVHHK